MKLKDLDKDFLTSIKEQLIEAHGLKGSDARALVIEAVHCLNISTNKTEDTFITRLQKQIDWYSTFTSEAIAFRLEAAKTLLSEKAK